MAYGQIDPARLDGDALIRWYLRSPTDIEQERQASAAQNYNDFFGNMDGSGGVSAAATGRQSPDDVFTTLPVVASGASQRSPAANAGNGYIDRGVYYPGQDDAQKRPAADTVWNCPTCHGRVPVPIPPPLLPLQPLLRKIPPSFGGASGSQWSDKPQCNQQFERDREICQVAKKPQCWENQNKRLGVCDRTGAVGTPPLRFGPPGR